MKPAAAQRRRQDAVDEVAQLHRRALGVLERLRTRSTGSSPRSAAARPSFSVSTVWTSRCWAPSCTSRCSRCRVSSAAATTLAREARSFARFSAFAIAAAASSANSASRFSVSAGSGRPAYGGQPPQTPLHDDGTPTTTSVPSSRHRRHGRPRHRRTPQRAAGATEPAEAGSRRSARARPPTQGRARRRSWRGRRSKRKRSADLVQDARRLRRDGVEDLAERSAAGDQLGDPAQGGLPGAEALELGARGDVGQRRGDQLGELPQAALRLLRQPPPLVQAAQRAPEPAVDDDGDRHAGPHAEVLLRERAIGDGVVAARSRAGLSVRIIRSRVPASSVGP